MIERPENKSNHSKDVILIKRDVSTGEPGNSGTFLSAEEKNDNKKEHPIPLEVLASSATFPASSPDENHAQIASDVNGKPGGEDRGARKFMFPVTQRFVIKYKQRGSQIYLCNRLRL